VVPDRPPVRDRAAVTGSPLRASEVTWAEPFPPHSAENVGEVEIRVLMSELKASTSGYIGHS
jgi:hypothetical protein